MAAQQNKIAYITGTSSGIGKALAEKLLDEGYEVFGMSRSNGIDHDNFTYIEMDLSDQDAVERFMFDDHENANVLLVNNAGTLGDVGPVGQIDSSAIRNVIQVNAIAAGALMNQFIAKYSSGNSQYHIINISSGAGKHPVDAWASYCASKAALDLFSRTVKEEMDARKIDKFHIHSIAPGVVDTDMQREIRSSDPQKFLRLQTFIDYKEEGELYSPDYVAEKLYEVVKNPSKFREVLFSVREY